MISSDPPASNTGSESALPRPDRALDTPPRDALERLARLATHALDVPIARIILMPDGRPHVAAQAVRTSGPPTALDSGSLSAFGIRTLHRDAPLIVRDAASDSRFANESLVTGAAGIRFFAGVPLATPDGRRWGLLCVMDTAPRSLTEAEQSIFDDLAATTLDELYLHHTLTEQRNTEHALTAERERLKQLANSIPGILYQFAAGPDGTREFRYISEQAKSLLDIDLDADNLFEHALQRIPPSHRAAVRASNEAAIAAREPWNQEFPFETPSGDIIWLEGLSRPHPHNDELIYHGVLLDITDRKRTEDTLRSTKQLLEKTLESLDEAVFVIDPADRSVLMCNSAVEDIFGYTKSEVIGATTEMLHLNQAAYEQFGTMSEPQLETTGRCTADFEMETKAGHRILTEHTITPLHDGEWAEGVVSVVRDVTEKRRTQEHMQLQAEALEATADAIAITDADGVISWINPAFETLTGYRANEAIGSTMELLRSGEQDAAFYHDLWDTVTSGHVWHGELVNRRKDGSHYVEEQTITPVADDDGAPHHFIAVKRDVTDRKQHEQELIRAKEVAEAAQAEAEQMNRLKSAFLANMSHEIRTPLTSIIGFSEVLVDLDLDPPADQFTAMIHRGGNRLLTTLNSVLDLSQLEAGAMQLHPEPVAVGPLVRDVASGFALRAEEAGVALHVDVDADIGASEQNASEQNASVPDRPEQNASEQDRPEQNASEQDRPEQNASAQDRPEQDRPEQDRPEQGTWARLDPAALERIVSNLLSNAIKFTGEGNASGGQVTVELAAEAERLVLTVADTGVGIDPAFVPRLFEAFQQESTGDARNFEGSGLGMTITRELVELMGGTIAVDSAKGEGTTVTVRLPRHLNALSDA